MTYSQRASASSQSGVSVGGDSTSHPTVSVNHRTFSQGGRVDLNSQMTFLHAQNSDVDHYFVKKLTWALEELSMAREGRVNYGSSHSHSDPSTLPNSLTANNKNNGGNAARRIKLPLLTLVDNTASQPPGCKGL